MEKNSVLNHNILAEQVAIEFAVPKLIAAYIQDNIRSVVAAEVVIDGKSLSWLQEALQELLRVQTMLRSSIKFKNGSAFFQLHRLPDKIMVWCTDLSQQSPTAAAAFTEDIQKALNKDMAGRKFDGGVLFNIAILKLDLRRIKIVFALSHLIADHEAVRILQGFFKCYGTPQYAEFKKHSAQYSEYAKVLSEQTDKCIREYKRTKGYLKLKSSVLGFYRNYPRAKPMHFSCGYVIECQLTPSTGHPIGKALSLILPSTAALFGLRHIPLRILLNNRSFGDMRYYNTLGDMHDILPILLDSRNNHPRELSAVFESYYTSKTADHINYTEMARRDRELHDVFYTPISVNMVNDFQLPQIKRIMAGTKEIPGVPCPVTVFQLDEKMLIFFPAGFSKSAVKTIRKILKDVHGSKIYKADRSQIQPAD